MTKREAVSLSAVGLLLVFEFAASIICVCVGVRVVLDPSRKMELAAVGLLLPFLFAFGYLLHRATRDECVRQRKWLTVLCETWAWIAVLFMLGTMAVQFWGLVAAHNS